MRADIESLWVFALASKCKSLTSPNTLFLLSLVVLGLAIINLVYWAHPGGPAWGKHKWSSRSNRTSKKKTVPGPRGIPVIGSMNLMSGLAHHKIAAKAVAYQAKRLMAFSLGETRVIVTCNPDVARELLNSSDFADRPVKESAYRLMFNRAIGFAPCGLYWRTLRRIAAAHLFCPKQIKASEAQRLQIARQMVQSILARAREGGPGILLKDVLKAASLNNMMCSVFGRHSFSPEEEKLLKGLVEEGYGLLGILNWSDHLPWLAEFDLQKVRFRCSQLVPKVNQFVSKIIDHRRKSRAAGDAHPRAFVDVLLGLQGPDKLSDSDMIAVLWEMIFRGTDTVAVSVEWILARMVLHPLVQSKVQQELDAAYSGAWMESDVMGTGMAYLSAVVKEVLRLHPPGPLLSWARLATSDTTVDGCPVPVGTTAMVNMWAIARDPCIWLDPLEFKPERFLRSRREPEFSIWGSDMRLAPFGSGRRTCPGKTLGLTTVTFWVATILREFEFGWTDECGEPDMSEVLRLSCEMAKPLRVMVRPRLVA